MAAEARLANTPINSLDPTLTKEVLYERLVDILDRNNIDEVGFLPFLPDVSDCTSGSESGSPLQYPYSVQEQGTKLGISVFCWVPLLDESYRILKDSIRGGSIEEGQWWSNPEEGHLDPQKELQFLNVALTFPRNCKSSGAWHHRKWLLCFIHRDHETIPIPPSEIQEQLRICHLAAERYPKCYYAWTMRHWLVEQLGRYWWNASLQDEDSYHLVQDVQTLLPSAQLQQGLLHTTSTTEGPPLRDHFLQPLLEEFERMKSHMQRNVSDHSTQQHFQQCMIQLSGKWIVQRAQQDERHDPTRAGGSLTTVLQWTRNDLASRRQRRDKWFKEHRDKANQSGQIPTILYRSAIKSIAVFAKKINAIDDDEAWTIDSMDADGIQSASYSWVLSLWISELRRTHDLIMTYPGHESLWYHLRFVHYGLRWLDCEMDIGDQAAASCETDGRIVEDHDELFISPATMDKFLGQILSDLTSGQEDGETGNATSSLTEALEKQREYADRYLKWVHRLDMEADAC
ncbi:Protein prenyltransferase alpha subunit repeat-containing protein 1 [Modicella reniformis]|uniref:Protein prenyltransferase alpha subunit repeat-containing protein 1 n=1 Tax=Modicella reniformis TaxID=1440133 RepID=A0A9P6SUP0_9FUNG|nr:Protein prenyltransferase alpha subunit repeat-containing protein 1 [Modicella reniformis]